MAHVTFPDMKRNNEWYEKKMFKTTSPLPVTLHDKIHYPASPLGALRNGWMITKARATMKHTKLFDFLQTFIKMNLKLKKTAVDCKNMDSQTNTAEYLTA